jgi:hypothetical protein
MRFVLFRNCRKLVVSLSLVILCSALTFGQSTYGSITGSVTDPSGAAVDGATVTLTNTGTSEKHTQTTSDQGTYSFVNVIPGQYRLDIEKPGFKRFSHPNVVVQAQLDTHLDTSLAVGAASEVVEVTSETTLLQTESASLGQVVEQRKANELPLNGRNIFNLITISPASVAQGGSGGSPVGQNPFSWGNYQIGGSFANQGAEYLDGQPLNIGYINLPIIIPSQDSIGEYKVQTNNQGAEWGKFSGGIVNLSTKSGTNSWHGSAYEYFRNKVLNANDYFHKRDQLSHGQKNEAPPWSQNQYGFQLGGPVFKNKTFFYTSWEQYRQRTGAPFNTTVPAAGMLNGDFGAVHYWLHEWRVQSRPNRQWGPNLPRPHLRSLHGGVRGGTTALWVGSGGQSDLPRKLHSEQGVQPGGNCTRESPLSGSYTSWHGEQFLQCGCLGW